MKDKVGRGGGRGREGKEALRVILSLLVSFSVLCVCVCCEWLSVGKCYLRCKYARMEKEKLGFITQKYKLIDGVDKMTNVFF